MTVRNVVFGAYCVVCLLAITWPGYATFGNRIEPFVLGLPFSLIWNMIWIGLSFIALLTYHLTGPRE